MWDLIVSVPDHCLSFYFKHVLVTKEQADMETSHSHYNSLEYFSKPQVKRFKGH